MLLTGRAQVLTENTTLTKNVMSKKMTKSSGVGTQLSIFQNPHGIVQIPGWSSSEASNGFGERRIIATSLVARVFVRSFSFLLVSFRLFGTQR